MLEVMNRAMFELINAPTDPGPTVLALARFSAQWLLYVVALGMVIGWLLGHARLRRALIVAGIAVVIGLVVNRLIGALWYSPRPFELGIGTNFLDHSVDSSFPSDHGTLLFAVAFGLLFSAGARGLGVLAMLVAGLVAWSRIYLGIHWPLDMAGSFVVAVGSAVFVSGTLAGPTARLAAATGAITDRILRRA
jgi:undecaprenyl-diphosphatase